MTTRPEQPALTLGERLLGAVATLLLIAAVLQGLLSLNHHEQHVAFEEDAISVARDVAVGVGELDTLMSALVGMHYADSDPDDALLALFERLQTQAPYVRSIGRYELVADEERARFERNGQDRGLYAFRITAVDDTGRTRTRVATERYYPISMLEPMSPARLRLLGADLGSVEGLGEALDRVTMNDTPLVTTLPASWPASGELLMFRAAYRGKHPPEGVAERLQQFDGGYWLAADLAAMLDGASGPLERFDLALHVDHGPERETLLERDASETRKLHFRSLYERHGFERRWPLGDGTIVLTLKADEGLSSRWVVVLAGTTVLLLIAIGTVAALLRNARLRIRERQRAGAALDAERERADRTLNAIDDAVFTLGRDHRVLHLNPAAARLLGHERTSVLGTPLSAALALRHAGSDRRFDLGTTLEALEHGGPRDLDLVCERTPSRPEADTDGETVLRLTLTRALDADGLPGGHILVLRDISAERQLTQRLEHQVNHDALTGCTNRRYFETRLDELLGEMPASGRRHALCYIDLDQFKIVNDTCGHTAGDRLLQDLTVNLTSLCREGDVLSRLGGDEFGLIIVDADPEEARAVADRVLAFFRSYVFHHGSRAFAVRASIGFVPLDASAGDIGDVLAAADLACYAAKDSGRNGLYTYSADDEAMTQRSSELNRLPELQRALAEDRFKLHVQAVARIGERCRAGRVTHFEFLLRLSDDEGRPITPFRIIEAAERYGLMREIDRWVIARAIATVAGLTEACARDSSFSINLSGQSAADPTLIDFIESEYERHAIEPARIWFELTETAAISQFSTAVELARRIRALGSKVALDDFGSGLSSFGYLKNIPVDVLKIDGQFVREIVADPVDRSIVRAIGEVARSMGIVTVAEFVEDQAIVDELIRIGIDYAQGYYIGRPCPLPEALLAIDTTRSRAA